jgi:hypothetical protein
MAWPIFANPTQNNLLISFLSWNCQGAKKKRFLSLLKDLKKLHDLQVAIILEPRISGDRSI